MRSFARHSHALTGALALLLVIALALLALAARFPARPAGAAAPAATSDPYATPDQNPQVPRARAQSLPPGAIVFANGTNTGPAPCVKALVPSINSTTKVLVCALVVRPAGGGSLHLIEFFTSDGIQATLDSLAYGAYTDCFGATPFVSDFSHTIKAMLNCKPDDSSNGNDRVVFPVDSHIPASDAP